MNKNGKDLYSEVLGFEPNYNTDRDTGKSEGQTEAMNAFKQTNIDYIKANMFIPQGGVSGSGIIHPAQIGGFDLDKIEINGQVTRSLKGIILNDGTKLENDVLMVQLPHPTYLSSNKRSQDQKHRSDPQAYPQTGTQLVAELVASAVTVLEPYAEAGWKIEPDAFRPEIAEDIASGKKTLFFEPNADGTRPTYTYGRSDIGPEYYDFGTPKNRMVSVSSAKRLKVTSRDNNKPQSQWRNKGGVIMFGTRDQPYLDKELIRDMLAEEPNQYPSEADVWTSRPRTPELLTVHDRGPGEEVAKLMKQNLPGSEIYDFVATGYSVGDFAHYRGTFNKPMVLVVSDPTGYDGLMTARAQTGTRGQYLHGLVKNIVIDGEVVGDKYLVLHTVPYGMDGMDDYNWNQALQLTKPYIEALLHKVVTSNPNYPKLIIADGKYAAEVIGNSEVYEASQNNGLPGVHFVDIDSSVGTIDEQMDKALTEIAANEVMDVAATNVRPSNIPRSHLSYYARTWEGTTGDRVLDLTGEGKVFAMVAPDWVVDSKPQTLSLTEKGIRALQVVQDKYCLPKAFEKIPEYLSRAQNCTVEE